MHRKVESGCCWWWSSVTVDVYVVSTLLQLQSSVPALGGHFLQLTVFLCRVKFRDPQYADEFVFKATLLPRAKWAFPLNCLFQSSTFIQGCFYYSCDSQKPKLCFFAPLSERLEMQLITCHLEYVTLICMRVSCRIPGNVLKPEDWDRGGNRGSWRPQLGFNPNRQQARLDQSSFRALGWVFLLVHIFVSSWSSRALFSIKNVV